MGQVILSQENERFENYVNDIIIKNELKKIKFDLFYTENKKQQQNEFVVIDWDNDSNIIVKQASTSYGLTLKQETATKYKYVEGYFSDIVKSNDGSYLEVLKISDKSLLIKGYDKGNLLIENKITLNDKKETILSEHTKYSPGNKKSIKNFTAYNKTKINETTVIKAQESYEILDGVKSLNHKFLTTETSSYDLDNHTETIELNTAATLRFVGKQTDKQTKIILTYDGVHRIIKIEYPTDGQYMTIKYD